MFRIQENNNAADKHFNDVKNLIQDRIKNILKSGIKKNKKQINLPQDFIVYLKSLLDDNTLKMLIAAKASEFEGIIGYYNVNHANFSKTKSHQNYVMRNIFISHCYNDNSFKKLDFIKNIICDTCPYCNRNYIYYLSKTGQIKPQIDHFFPKNIYPFLAISFYNLIPCCQTCNGFGAKEEKDPLKKDLINPYLIENINFKFMYEIKNINFLNPLLNKTSIDVKFKHKLDGHIEVFKLDKLYQEHSDHILDLIIKSRIAYSEEYRKYLKTFNGLKFSDHEIDRMILGNYSQEEEIHKRPLAKMYQDIGVELGLIKK
jgi:uncharacterized protein YeeX (DUF496 family)